MRQRMRNAVLLFCAIVSVAGVLGLTSNAYATYHNQPPGEEGGGGSNWTRQDENCQVRPEDPPRQKTYCYQNGTEQCTAQYCNP